MVEYTSLEAMWAEAVAGMPELGLVEGALYRASFYHGAASVLFAIACVHSPDVTDRLRELQAEIKLSLPAPPPRSTH